MFEKEGIKYAIEETVGTECLSMPIEDFHFIDLAESQQEKAQCFKDGAEFGYNKAKAEMQEQGLALQSDMDKTIEQNIVLKKELEKANEWHKPSEKLPEECTLVLAYSFDDTEPSLYEYVASDTWEWMPRRIASLSNDQIRLWKEIIPSKEIKEND